MKLFLDTSVLVKKYIKEPGQARVEALLADTSVVVVSPVTWIEIHHAFYRMRREGLLDARGLKVVLKELQADYIFFHIAAFNNALEEKAVHILEGVPLRSGDAIQLAAAITTKSDLFCTADHTLCQSAKKYLKKIELI